MAQLVDDTGTTSGEVMIELVVNHGITSGNIMILQSITIVNTDIACGYQGVFKMVDSVNQLFMVWLVVDEW